MPYNYEILSSLTGDKTTNVYLLSLLSRIGVNLSQEQINRLISSSLASAMPEVKPGDLITADLFNGLLLRLTALEDIMAQGGDKLDVPDLIGLTLAEGVERISKTDNGFTLGSVIDIYGVNLSSKINQSGTLKILNQVPAPGMKVQYGGEIKVVLSGHAAAPAPSGQPEIESILDAGGHNIGKGAKLQVLKGTNITIVGRNFWSGGKTIVEISALPDSRLPSFGTKKITIKIEIKNPSDKNIQLDVIDEINNAIERQVRGAVGIERENIFNVLNEKSVEFYVLNGEDKENRSSPFAVLLHFI